LIYATLDISKVFGEGKEALSHRASTVNEPAELLAEITAHVELAQTS